MCAPSVLGERYRGAYESVRKVDYMNAKLSHYLMKIYKYYKRVGRKKDCRLSEQFTK